MFLLLLLLLVKQNTVFGVCALWYLDVRIRYGDVVVLPLVLVQQFKPAADRTTEYLAHSERESAHEVIPRGSVPVPYLDGQAPVPLPASD